MQFAHEHRDSELYVLATECLKVRNVLLNPAYAQLDAGNTLLYGSKYRNSSLSVGGLSESLPLCLTDSNTHRHKHITKHSRLSQLWSHSTRTCVYMRGRVRAS